MPVGVVVALLVAFESSSCSSIVLTSINRRFTNVLIGNEESLVALARVTIFEVARGLVIAEGEVFLFIAAEIFYICGRSVVVGSVAHKRVAHVLKNNFATASKTTTVSCCVFDG